MISIIIPVYNECLVIEDTLKQLQKISCSVKKEIIVVDGGSTDETVEISQRYATVIRTTKGKANQLNVGAGAVSGEIFFFVHADMFVPNGALSAICNSIENGFEGGGFSNVFANNNRKIKRYGNIMNFRFFKHKEQSDKGIFYGDNGIFVTRKVFNELNGFKEALIMEDYDFSVRMKASHRVIKIVNPPLILSDRRHEKAGYLYTRFQWVMIKKLYLLGVSPNLLARWYRDVR